MFYLNKYRIKILIKFLTQLQKDQRLIMKLFEMTNKILLNQWRVRDEHIVQGNALFKLMGDIRSNELEIALINHFGKEFRTILDEFKSKFKSLPSPDDLIWIAGVHAGKDPREIVKDIVSKINKSQSNKGKQ